MKRIVADRYSTRLSIFPVVFRRVIQNTTEIGEKTKQKSFRVEHGQFFVFFNSSKCNNTSLGREQYFKSVCRVHYDTNTTTNVAQNRLFKHNDLSRYCVHIQNDYENTMKYVSHFFRQF